MANTAQYINWGKFPEWEAKIKTRNENLLQKLREIQKIINDTSGVYESDAAVSIREKINGMEPRIQDYYNVVDNFKIFISNTSQDVQAMEKGIASNADQFI